MPKRLLPLLLTTAAATCYAGAAAASTPGACTQTTTAAATACQNDAQDNYWIKIGVCANLANATAAKKCRADATANLADDRATCGEQKVARDQVCAAVGEAPYDPVINPANFVDPADIGGSVAANPYFPLLRGRVWVYRNGTERITVTVTPRTRTILGVKVATVRDVATDSGVVIEDTDDWYAQDKQGNVWYFGELSQKFVNGRIAGIDGSWTAGVEGGKAGIIMRAKPGVGAATYRQEFSLDNAEDMGEVLSLTGSATTPAASCSGTCLVTRDFTPIDPGNEENKYFSPGIGEILAVDPVTGDREELISFTP